MNEDREEQRVNGSPVETGGAPAENGSAAGSDSGNQEEKERNDNLQIYALIAIVAMFLIVAIIYKIVS